MEYGFKLNNKRAETAYKLELDDCVITGNTVQYHLKDNSIMVYDLDENGYPISSTGREIENVELTRTPLSVFEFVAEYADKNENGFDKKDLKKLDKFDLGKAIVNKLFAEGNYNLQHIEITKKSIHLTMVDINGNERNLEIEFMPKKFGTFFKNLFKFDRKPKPERAQNETKSSVDTNIVVGDLEEHPIEIGKGIYDKVAELEDVKSMNETTEMIDTRTSKVALASTKDVYDDMYNIIPKEYDKYIKQIAENAGVSENLVKTFIINEGKPGSKEAALDAYKRKGDVWTIGFGHTNLCRKMDFKVKEGTSITIEKAFELLEGDIKEMKKYARTSVGTENFDNAPLSLQALFIEYCFQYGPGGRLKSPNMKANLAGGYKEAIAAGSLFEGNYSRRSAYRFMLAINDFTVEERQAALRRLKSKGNYDKILASLSGKEKKMFVDFCRFVEEGV